MDLINGYLQKYEWGSLNALAELRGIEASGSPEAELWFGVHPSGPATLEREHGKVTRNHALNLSLIHNRRTRRLLTSRSRW